jgi:hypothetical protein
MDMMPYIVDTGEKGREKRSSCRTQMFQAASPFFWPHSVGGANACPPNTPCAASSRASQIPLSIGHHHTHTQYQYHYHWLVGELSGILLLLAGIYFFSFWFWIIIIIKH